MITYSILKFSFIVLDLSAPIVNGVFAPVFSLGCVVGRLYGHFLVEIGTFLGVKLVRSK
jgi:H+/Cl- antiporter ClcA